MIVKLEFLLTKNMNTIGVITRKSKKVPINNCHNALKQAIKSKAFTPTTRNKTIDASHVMKKKLTKKTLISSLQMKHII